MGRRSCDATLPLTSTGTGRGGKSGSGGDTATDNEIMAPAAMITQPDASSCFACIAATVCAIRGFGMTDLLAPTRVSGKAVPPSQWALHPAMSRFAPESRHREDPSKCLLSTNSRHSAVKKNDRLAAASLKFNWCFDQAAARAFRFLRQPSRSATVNRKIASLSKKLLRGGPNLAFA